MSSFRVSLFLSCVFFFCCRAFHLAITPARFVSCFFLFCLVDSGADGRKKPRSLLFVLYFLPVGVPDWNREVLIFMCWAGPVEAASS